MRIIAERFEECRMCPLQYECETDLDIDCCIDKLWGCFDSAKKENEELKEEVKELKQTINRLSEQKTEDTEEVEEPKFSVEKFLTGEQVVNCRTENEAIAFCSWLYFMLDKMWKDGDSYLNRTNWNVHKGNTCYTGDSHYGSISHYTKEGKQIVRYTSDIVEIRPSQEVCNEY